MLSNATKRKATRNKSRLEAEDWIDAASTVLAKGGIDAVRVEPIATKLGVTKGSFYWHFKDRSALHAAILDRWRKDATSGVIRRLGAGQLTAQQKLNELLLLPRRGARAVEGANLEMAIRRWASRDKAALSVVREVDELRMSFISSLYQELGFSPELARAKAFILFSALLGEALISIRDTVELLQLSEELLTKPEDD